MSNIIKSNYIYVTENDKKIIDFSKMDTSVPGLGFADSTGFQNIDYSNEAYKVDAVPKTEENVISLENGVNKEFAMEELERIRIEANELIENAKAESQNIIDRANEMAQEIKDKSFEEAKNDGYAQGYDLAQKEVEELKESLRVQEQTNNEEYENKVLELEQAMADVTASLIERITGIEVEDQNVIAHVIKRTFSNIENSQDYVIKVCTADYQSVAAVRDELYDYVREGAQIDVISDDSLERNQCVIETDVNIIDCSLGEQLKNLARELKLLSLE